MYPFKPIRTEAEYTQVMREIDAFLADIPAAGSREADRLEVLSILVHAYEHSHPDHRIDEKVEPVEAVKFHLDRLGKTPKDLEIVLKCSRTRVWEILNRKRALTLAQIRALVAGLGIPADCLLAEDRTAVRRQRKQRRVPAKAVVGVRRSSRLQLP